MRFLLRLLGVGVSASLVAVACASADFSSENAPHQGSGGSGGTAATGGTSGAAGDMSAGAGGSTAATGGTGATGGTAGGGTTLCSEAKDCDDKDPCTLDVCGADGICQNPAKCGGDQPACCNGVCSHCCSSADCDDQLSCTDDSCFAGVCNHLPGTCGPGEYCSTDPASGPTGCMAQEACSADADCDDGDPCTTDACDAHKCVHPTCPGGGTCCPGRGCGTCCADSQCPQGDPCNPSTCGADLECVTTALCASGDLCCKSSDGKTAACGECCGASDCPSDGVACTQSKCKADTKGYFTCFNVPNPDLCPTGETCDLKNGCTAAQCKETGDCPAPNACKQVTCKSGTCLQTDVRCSGSQHCCAKTSGKCQDCCDNLDCTDPAKSRCCSTGTCAECCADSDCLSGVTAGTPQASGVGTSCPIPHCNSGTCNNETTTCTAVEKCCPGVGCVPLTEGTCPGF